MNHVYSMLKREKEFRFLWLGYTLTVFGEWFAVIAINLYVWNAYESMILSSISLAINMIPTVFLGPLLGGLVDWCSKKKMAVFLSVFNCMVLLIPVLFITMFNTIYVVCIFNFLIGVVSCIRYPWINSYLPSVVKEEDLLNANSLISFSKTSGQLIMPLLSGLLLAEASSSVLYLFNILFLILAMAAFSRLSGGRPANKQKRQKKARLFEVSTWKAICSDKKAMTVSLTIMCLLFLDGATDLLLIVETQRIPEKADVYYGAVTTIKGLGMALASMGAYKWLASTKKNYIHLLCFLSYLKILLICLMGQVTAIPGFALIVFLEAYLWISITIIEKCVMQSIFPAADRAKIFAMYGSMCWLAGSAGTLFFGFLSEMAGIPIAIAADATLVSVMLIVVHRHGILWEMKKLPSKNQKE